MIVFLPSGALLHCVIVIATNSGNALHKQASHLFIMLELSYIDFSIDVQCPPNLHGLVQCCIARTQNWK